MTNRFAGFPARLDFTAVPTTFITRLMPEIDDINELKVTLHLIQALYHKRGYPRYVSFADLASDKTLLAGLKPDCKTPAETLRHALDRTIERGVVIGHKVEGNGTPDEVFVLNSEEGRKGLEKLLRGELTVRAIPGGRDSGPLPKPDNIFTMYEQNIGMLTPIIAEELRSAEREYPAKWVEEAFKEAVALNKRNWRYIARILENWATKGKDGKPGRPTQREDPEKYFKGEYGHLVRH